MIIDVAAALEALNVDEWKLDGNPSNEAEFNSMFRKLIGGSFSNDPSDFGVTWSQVSSKLAELQNAEPMRLLRKERNRRLAETDWWASSDLTMTQAQTNYRQALRDITDSATSLDDVTWPEKP